MEQIRNKDIHVTRHMTDGFTLAWFDDQGRRYARRYVDYGVREAKRLFKEYVREASVTAPPPALSWDDVMIGALQTISGGDRETASRLVRGS
jgi:hypothetical protein